MLPLSPVTEQRVDNVATLTPPPRHPTLRDQVKKSA
jgi:hypothetical protein